MNTKHQGAASKNAGTPLRYKFLPLFLALVALLSATGCATTSPQALYRSVWKATPEHIYDPEVLLSWHLWENRYEGRLNSQEDAERAIAEMLASTGDRYTYFMNPRAISADNARREGTFTGVGIVLDMKVDKRGQAVRNGDGTPLPRDDDGGFPVVVKVIKGSPAEKAGLAVGDAITSINGIDTRGRSLNVMVEQLRGDAGTTVTVGVRRANRGWNQTLTRATVDVPAVTTRILSAGIGYLRLEGFEQNDAIAEVKAGLEALKDCKALIVDMRGNRGGLVYNAVEIAAFFVAEGRVVTISHRIPGSGYRTEVVRLTREKRVRTTSTDQSTDVDAEVSARQPHLANGRPVVVLVNGMSASATELFVGAVKDNGAATIIGTRTYGKGIGQSNIDMPNGTRLHVTSLRYFTPNGTWIGDGGNTQPIPNGIVPQITVEPGADLEFGERNDNQLERAIELLKERLGRVPARPEFRTGASCAG